MRFLDPAWFERLASFEDAFDRTIQRTASIRAIADRGRPYLALAEQPELARRALAHVWDEPVLVRPAAWSMPAGAFGDGAGPT